MARNTAIAPARIRLSERANLTLALKLLAAGSGYVFMMVLTRTMALDGFGTVAFFLNVALLASVVGARGQQMALLRHLPPLAASGDTAGAQRLIRIAARRAGTATLTVAALTAVGLLAIRPGWLAGMTGTEILLGISLIPLVGWLDFQSHVARGFHFLKLALIPREILWRGSVALVALAIFFGNGRTVLAPTSVLALLIAGLVAIGMFQAWLLLRHAGFDRSRRTAAGTGGDQPDKGHAFWVNSVSNMFLSSSGVVIVGLFLGAEEAALFFAAERLTMLLALVKISHNIVLGPMLSEAWHDKGTQRAVSLIHHATIRSFLPTALLAAALTVGAPWILAFFGPGYAGAVEALRLLVLAGLINAAGGAGDVVLNMCGEHRAAMRVSLIALACSAASLLAGVMLGGATGVALAVVLATALRKALFWQVCKRKLGLHSDVLSALLHQPIRPVRAA